MMVSFRRAKPLQPGEGCTRTCCPFLVFNYLMIYFLSVARAVVCLSQKAISLLVEKCVENVLFALS